MTYWQAGLSQAGTSGVCDLDGRSQTGAAKVIHGVLWDEQP